MKKYLITGAMALMAGFYLTSCTHDDVGYSSLYEEKTQTYDKVFKELYGTIDPNHDWGFKALGSTYNDTRALTRAVDDNGNIWYQNWERPYNVNLSTAEINELKALLTREPETYNAEIFPYENYYIEQIYKGESEDYAYDNNGNKTNTKVKGSDKMNHLQARNGNKYEHSDNFNAGGNSSSQTDEGNGQTYVGITLMKSMSLEGITATNQFGYDESWGTENGKFYNNYLIVQYKGEWYVGFDFEAHKSTATKNNGEAMQVYRDWAFTDWIVRIKPATKKQGGGGETTTSRKYKADQHRILARGRVFVEDLYNASREDLDFNDAVFDAIIWEITRGTVTVEDNGTKTFVRDETIAAKDSVEISLLAAGGTIPLKIAGDKFGEVHGVFATANPNEGISGVTMVNSRGNYSEAFGSYVNGVTPVYGKFDYTSELQGKDPEDITLNDIQVSVFWKAGDYTAAAILNKGETQFDEEGNIIKQTDAPHMLCTPIGTRWATERKNIMEGYPGFRSYVNNSSNSGVWESATQESTFNLYEDNPTPLKYGTMDLDDCIYYDNIEVIEEVLWNENPEYFYSSSKNFEVPTVALNERDVIRIYGGLTGNTNDPWMNFSLVDNSDSWVWDSLFDNRPTFSNGYFEITVNAEAARTSKDGKRRNVFGVWAKNLYISKISVIRN